MKGRRFSHLLAALGLLAIAAPIFAQDKAMLIDDMERLRSNTLRMIEAMPASGLRTAPTAGVRDFAEQIEHVAVGALNITASGLDADRIPVGDKEVYLNSKEALARMVTGAFNQVRAIIEAMSQDELATQGMLLGQTPTPRWKIVQAAHEHGVWTLGATVPYVRLNGGTPPAYGLVPAVR